MRAGVARRSIEWCCFPRFDCPAVFSRILDWGRGGYFELAPLGVRSVERHYIPGTNILGTTFTAAGGVAELTDFMPVHPHDHPGQPTETGSRRQIVRRLTCTSGSVRFRLECRPRFDYGTVVPHVQVLDQHTGFAHGSGDAISMYASAPLEERDGAFLAEGLLREGEMVCAAVTYQEAFEHKSETLDIEELLRRLRETTE